MSDLLQDETFAERLARRFHTAYEEIAPQFGYETRPESAVPWEQVPTNQRNLMVAVCKLIEDDLRRHLINQVQRMYRRDADGTIHLIQCENCSTPEEAP